MQTQTSAVLTDPDTTQAAIRIQRAWRRILSARTYPPPMDPDSRWKDAVVEARMKVDRLDADMGKNDSRTRWKRAGFLVSRIQDKNTLYARDTSLGDTRSQEDKMLETQHWLELVDAKHRYGSNLKWYHKQWQQDDTTDNFFKWFDQRIIYLSSEQRINYLVIVDDQGKLRWARNNVLVDTTEGKWYDLGEGEGVILQDGTGQYPPTPPRPRVSFGPVSSTSSVEVGPRQGAGADHYNRPPKGRTRFGRAVRRHFTLKGVMDRLLRKTVRKNTWIYVTDKSFNIFIGIKETGSFQHSSFLAGGLVTSAGLISVKEGLIYKLSPLSGHYRTSVGHFRNFVDGLSERGVDMRKAKISKAEMVLCGIEQVSKANRARHKAAVNAKGHIQEAFRGWGDDGEEARAGAFSTWKREIMEGRKGSRL